MKKVLVGLPIFGVLIPALIYFWGPYLKDQFNKGTVQTLVAEGQGKSEAEAL